MSESRYEDIELDTRDLLCYILKKWKLICVISVIFGFIGLGYALVKPDYSNTTIEERAEDAAGILTEQETETVERLYAQYESYMNYKSNLQNYLSSYTYSDDKLANRVQKIIQYSFYSAIDGAETTFSQLSLTPEVYEQIMEISPEYKNVSDIYKTVRIESIHDKHEKNTNGSMLISEYSQPVETVLTVTIIAGNKDQCTAVQALIDNALQLQLHKLQAVDSDARLTYIGENYNYDLQSWVSAQQKTIIGQLQEVETAITDFNDEQIDSLSADQKNYYNLLMAMNNGQEVTAERPSGIKYSVIGLILGMLLSLVGIVLKYTVSDDIKIEDELNQFYHIPVLSRIDVDHNESGLFGNWIKALRNSSTLSYTEKIVLAASDISILMNKNNLSSLYMICSSESDDELSIAKDLKDHMLNDNSDYKITIGKPLSSSDELKKLSSSKNVLFVTHLKQAKRDTVSRLAETAERYGLNVVGAVTVEVF